MIEPIRRTVLVLPIGLAATSAFVFSLPAITGIDPAAAVLKARFAESEPDPVTLAALRSEMGLDASWWVRYGRFVGNAIRGDFGLSSVSQRSVAGDVAAAFGVSLTLMLASLALAVIAAVPLGLLSAARAGGRADRAVTRSAAVGSALPEHVVGPLSILVLAVWLGVTSSGGWQHPGDVVLPAIVLCSAPLSALTILIRAEVLDCLDEPFIRTARAKGISEWRVLTRHALRNSQRSLISVGGVFVAGLTGGAVVVETIFSIPGLGRYTLEALRNSDLPATQAGLLVLVAFSITVGAAVDLVSTATDPRLRSE